jgi:diguanylate cyclase (GGDEF)-like protein
MKRSIIAIAVLLGWVCAAYAAQAPLTTLRAIHNLTNAEASHALPVAFEATVVYYRGRVGWLFVQDDGVAIFVHPPANNTLALLPGDRLLVNGTTHDSFRPFITGTSLTLLHHGELPSPAPATFDELIRGDHDAQRVTVRATIRAVNPGFNWGGAVYSTTLQLLTDGGIIDATVDGDHASELNNLLDSEVEVTGVTSGEFDGKMQQIGIVLRILSPADIKLLKHADASPWSLPVTPMDEVLRNYHLQNLTRRVRIHGTITYYQPGSAIILQDGDKSLWVNTMATGDLHIGDLADVTGFPEAHDGRLILTNAEISDKGIQAPIAPVTASWLQLASRGSDIRNHIFDLVSIEGQVITAVREASQDEYVVMSDGQLLTAIYSYPDIARRGQTPPMIGIAPGTRVRLTGICIPDKNNPLGSQAFHGLEPFSILLRSPKDIAVVAKPSLLNVRNLILLASGLLLVVVAVGAWGWTLKSKVQQQTGALAKRIEAEAAAERNNAQLEVRRSRILEDISGSKPLAEIIEQITALVSFRLDGVPCWCEIIDGARLGCYPAETEGMRLCHEIIPARNGSPLGMLFAGFDASGEPSETEHESLIVGARLATLAIETRRLYSTLTHRSEFDQLTDAHNRFSLDKHLTALIEDARMSAAIFGLIYIDLDHFKLVNDLYGHHVGDLYLQEVTLRMKSQLRGVDRLARIGGDEFAVLVGVVHNRADVEEIALRLERCFDEAFVFEGYVLRGSASLGIALYPEDGVTKDALLNCSDAAMYVAKHGPRNLNLTAEHS